MRELPLEKMLENVRRKSPLIHSITNYVTANDCANMLLACGASPIMAEDIGEAAEITSLCQGLVINLGTLNQNKIPSMLAAGRRANKLGHPVVFDPVGAGASKLRTQTALQMIKEIRFSVVRANHSEMKALMGGSEIGKTRGVDADVSDQITAENGEEAADFARRFARQTGAVAAITGAIDIVADADNVYSIRNGHPMMSAFGIDSSLYCSQSRYAPGSSDSSGVRDGGLRGDWLWSFACDGRQRVLSELYH